MTEFRRVTDAFSVSPQIGLDDVAAAASKGFTMIINNRPEGESPDQVPGAEIEAAARAAGLDYVAIPVVGGPNRAQAEAMYEAVQSASGPVLAYCRSGTRSINTWAAGQAMSGARTPAELVELGFGAGYDLRPLLG